MLAHYRFRVIVNRIHPYPLAADFVLLVIAIFVNFTYVTVTMLVDYCQISGAGSAICAQTMTNQGLLVFNQSSKAYTASMSNDHHISDAIMLSMFSTLVDYALGTFLLVALANVPRIRKMLNTSRGFEFRQHYQKRAYILYGVWSFLLVLVIVLTMSQRLVPGIVNSVHPSQIIGNTVQLLNTIQFILGFELMAAIELIMRIGVNRVEARKRIKKESENSNTEELIQEDVDSNDLGSVSGFENVKKNLSPTNSPGLSRDKGSSGLTGAESYIQEEEIIASY